MKLELALTDVIDLQKLSSTDLFGASWSYLADRLDHPAVADLQADLGRLVDDLPTRLDVAAADGRALRRAALAVLENAWIDTAERPRVTTALESRTVKLPAADTYPLALALAYGLYQLLNTRHHTSTTANPRTGDHRTVESSQGLIAVLAELLKGRGRRGPDDLVRLLPGEGHFSIAVLDIQGSEQLPVAERLAAHAWLATTVQDALAALRIPPGGAHVRDTGDGSQILLDESAIGLTTLVRKLPPLLSGPLAGHRQDSGPLRVRLALHTDLLHRTEVGWDGAGLTDTARFVDADEVKTMLARSPHRLATILSTRVYEAMAFCRDPAREYRPVSMRLRGEAIRVWVALS
jgi:hypothetical protein